MAAALIFVSAIISLALVAGLFGALIAWNRAEIEVDRLRQQIEARDAHHG